MTLVIRAGAQAYADGFARHTNPHSPWGPDYYDWLEGWDWAFSNDQTRG